MGKREINATGYLDQLMTKLFVVCLVHSEQEQLARASLGSGATGLEQVELPVPRGHVVQGPGLYRRQSVGRRGHRFKGWRGKRAFIGSVPCNFGFQIRFHAKFPAEFSSKLLCNLRNWQHIEHEHLFQPLGRTRAIFS